MKHLSGCVGMVVGCSVSIWLAIPALAQEFPNLRRLTPADRPKFDSTVLDGRNQMPPWRGVVSDEQIDQIWTYIRSISDR